MFCKCRPGLVRERVMGDPERQESVYRLSKWVSAFRSKMIKLKLNLFAEFPFTNDDIFTVWKQ